MKINYFCAIEQDVCWVWCVLYVCVVYSILCTMCVHCVCTLCSVHVLCTVCVVCVYCVYSVYVLNELCICTLCVCVCVCVCVCRGGVPSWHRYLWLNTEDSSSETTDCGIQLNWNWLLLQVIKSMKNKNATTQVVHQWPLQKTMLIVVYQWLLEMVCSCLTGGGGFFLACKDFGRMFSLSFPACTFFFFFLEISLRSLIPLFRPGSVHSGSASWGDCDQVFPDELRMSSFPNRFPHSAWTAA